jgi:hypothetical protein
MDKYLQKANESDLNSLSGAPVYYKFKLLDI